ncbi:MFS transporter OS=Streptomyces antimycoticus OX=68175 GN=SANT12839_073250 PE=4 SV=1 [Streptomyces antimycoticus]
MRTGDPLLLRGGFSTVPAYLKDLFGTYQVGAIHGRLLTAWSVAGVLGPYIVNKVADHQEEAGKTGPGLYSLSLTIMIALLIVGFIANELVRPVHPRFHEPAPATADTKAAPAKKGADR